MWEKRECVVLSVSERMREEIMPSERNYRAYHKCKMHVAFKESLPRLKLRHSVIQDDRHFLNDNSRIKL